MHVERPSLESWLAELTDPTKPISFSRWGDGEWKSVLSPGGEQTNCDGHKYFPEMGKELQNVLHSRPAYRLGMQPLALRIFKKNILGFLQHFKLDNLIWYDADVFHRGAIAGRMPEILKAINSRKVLLVGPAHLKDVPFKYWKQVVVPNKNVYLSLASVMNQINGLLAGKTEPLLISISASMPAEIMVDRLYHKYGHLHTIIDFGSLWDPLVGVRSRSYMRK